MVSATTRLARARVMRHGATDAEKRLWSMLRDRRCGGAKFRRQAPVGPFIVDFLCVAERLIVEADGGQHAESEYDASRDAYLRANGFRVLRFWNNEILSQTEGVRAAIETALGTPHPPKPAAWAPPSPLGRGA